MTLFIFVWLLSAIIEVAGPFVLFNTDEDWSTRIAVFLLMVIISPVAVFTNYVVILFLWSLI